MLVVHRLAQVVKDPVLKRLILYGFIGECGKENRRDRVSGLAEVFVELNTGHPWHVNVSNQAVGFRNERRRKEICC